jgi:uncharacterized protein (DUF433 family)
MAMPDSPALEKFDQVIAEMSPGEKARGLQRLAGQVGGIVPGIDTNPAVCGGEACIARTRIPVWLLIRARELGASEASLLAAYPMLRAEDLVSAWAYAQLHPDEIGAQIASHEAA